MDNNEKQQFQQWLPYFVNGSLNDNDRTWMNQYLTEHPKAILDVEIERALKTTLVAELPEFAADKGLNDFMRRVHADTDTYKASRSGIQTWQIVKQRCANTIGTLFISPRWAVAVTVLVAQTGLIGVLLSERTVPIIANQTEWRSVGETSAYQGPVLRITFKPSATEKDMRLLLVTIQGTFLGGPGQLGNYFVKVSGNTLEEAEKQIQNSPIIESVQALPALPLE